MAIRKKVIVAAANHWHAPFQVGSHHLARSLAKAGWEVAFISDPISPWHLCAGNWSQLRERYGVYAAGGNKDLDAGVWSYVPGALLTPHNKPILRSRWVSRNWATITWPRINRVLRNAGFARADLVYCDSVVPFSWLRDVPHDKAIYRIADQYAGFGKCSPAMAQLEREVAQWVDAVVYAAQSLEAHVKSLAPRTMVHLPNGVNFEHFRRRRKKPEEYDAIPKPIAVYVGAMDVWFDWDLMNYSLERLSDVSFVLIGPDERAKKLLKPAKNLWLLGPRPYEDLPGYLQHADVGLIPFDVDNHRTLVRTIHPLKLYEYLASGLPVVAVEWEELQGLKSPAKLSRSREGFITDIRQVLSTPHDTNALQQYTAGKDWSMTVQKLLEIVGIS